MTKKGTIYITVTVLTCVLTLYFSQFHEGLSRSSSDWGVFADFVSGTLSPLLAFININYFINIYFCSADIANNDIIYTFAC